MRPLILAYALAMMSSPALAAPGHSCIDRAGAKENIEKRGGSFITVTPEQWQFLRGIYAMNPTTPPGLPFGDSAVIARVPGDQGAIILFMDGNSACTPMTVPNELIEMLDEVGGGDIPHSSGPA